MSIATEITRIQAERNALRTKLIALGLAQSTDDLEALVDAVEGIVAKGAPSGTISSKSGSYTISAGYYSGGSVAITQDEQAKIAAGNIKSGVSILGVAGSYSGEPVVLQEKSVTPSEEAQTITFDNGYDGLESVAVAAIPSSYAIVTITTAIAANVLSGKVIIGADGSTITGTMANNGAVTATIDGMNATSYTVPQGYHSGAGTVTLTSSIETALAAI